MLHLYLVNGVPKNFFHGFRQYVFCPNINIIFRKPSIERKFKNLDVYVFNTIIGQICMKLDCNLTLSFSGTSLDRSLDARSLSLDFRSASLLSLRLLVSRSLEPDSLLRDVESLPPDEFSAIEIFVRPAADVDFPFSELAPDCSVLASFDDAVGLVSDVGGAFFVT